MSHIIVTDGSMVGSGTTDDPAGVDVDAVAALLGPDIAATFPDISDVAGVSVTISPPKTVVSSANTVIGVDDGSSSRLYVNDDNPLDSQPLTVRHASGGQALMVVYEAARDMVSVKATALEIQSWYRFESIQDAGIDGFGANVARLTLSNDSLHTVTPTAVKNVHGMLRPATMSVQCVVHFVNLGDKAVTLKHESGTATTPEERFFLPGAVDAVMSAYGFFSAIYLGDSRWHLLAIG